MEWNYVFFFLIVCLITQSIMKPVQPHETFAPVMSGRPGKDLLPLMNPMHNVREICKQSILLEDHLSQCKKRCNDCICKHFLTIEALAEEAISLDHKKKYRELLKDLPEKIRVLEREYLKCKTCSDKHNGMCDISQKLRKLRKKFQTKVFPIM